MIRIKWSYLLLVSLCFLIGVNQSYGQTNQKDALGNKQGYWKSYDEMGHLKYEGNFKDDIPFGEFKYYYPDGKIRAISIIFNEGKQSRTKLYHRNEKLMAEGNYMEQKKDSTWSYFSEYDGVLLSKENYKRGNKEGLWQKFYPNKTVAEESTFKNDVQVGVWIQYFTNGTKKIEGFFVEGKKDGRFTYYHLNGQIETVGMYVNSLKDGNWKYFSEEGKSIKEELYKNGKLESTHIF